MISVSLWCPVIGCRRSDVPSVPGAKVIIARDGRTAVVECERGQREGYVRWSLNCVDDRWIGNVGNCTGAAVADGNDSQLGVFIEPQNIFPEMLNEAKILRPRPRPRPEQRGRGRGRGRGLSFEVEAEAEARAMRSRPISRSRGQGQEKDKVK